MSFIVLFLMFIVVLVISFILLWFTDGMSLFGGGGIGFGRTPWCIPTGGFVQIWFPLLPFFSVNPISRLVVLVSFQILLGLKKNSERPGFPTFAALGKGRPALTISALEVDGWLALLPEVHLARLTGQVLGMEWILTEVSRLRSGRLSQKKTTQQLRETDP